MKYKLLLFISIFSLKFYSQTEESISFGLESNSQYYVDDKVTGDFTESNPFRSNNYFKIEYKVQQFTFGVQVESYAPKSLLNYSPNFDDVVNLGLYYANYTGEKMDVTLGHFFEQIGSGLILRAYEDRQLGINNAIRGAKIAYKPSENLSLMGFYGNQRVGFDVSKGKIFGMDINLNFPQMFKKETISGNMGLSYVGRHEQIESENPDFNPLTSALSLRTQLNFTNIYTGFEGVLKTKDAYVEMGNVNDEKLFYGNALLYNLGYSKKGFGINTTLRRLENMSIYTDRASTGNTFNELLVNYTPALTKQHDYSLTNLYVYQAQPALSFNPLQKAGEIGGQIDVFYNFKKETPLGGKYGTKMAMNFATWYGLKADFISEFQRVDVSFLGFGEHYFSDFSLEIRKKLSEKVSGIFTYVNGNYNKKYIEETYDFVKSNVIVADATFQLNDESSLRAELQHLWTQQDKKNWAASTVEWNVNSNFSFFATDLYNYGNEDKNHRDHYYLMGGSYSKNSTRLALSYGRQRGGVLCVGGVCREVPAATGLTFNLTTSF